MKRIFIIAMITVITFVLSANAFCQQLTLHKLVNMSSDIVRVEVLSVKCFYHEESKHKIRTSVIVTIIENLKGTLKAGSKIELIRYGGVIGDKFVRLNEYATFETGQSSILFLKGYTHDYFGQNYSIIGGDQGKFNIDENEIVARETKATLTISDSEPIQYFTHNKQVSSAEFIDVINKVIHNR